MKTIGSVLKRLLLALGGTATGDYYNDITLVDMIAALAENGQIPASVLDGGGIQTPVSVQDGGTGANNAAGARANLGIVNPNFSSLIFGEEVKLTLTAPSGITILRQDVYGQKTADGKFLRVRGLMHMLNPNDTTNTGLRDFSVSGITVTPPASTVTLKGIGFRKYSFNGDYDTIDWGTIYNDFVDVVVDTSGNIKIQLRIEFGNANTTSQYFIFPHIIALA